MSLGTTRARFALCAFLFVLTACGGSHASSQIIPSTTMLAQDAPAPIAAPQASVSLATSTTSTNSVGLFQVFDEFGSNIISTTTASTDGSRYAAVWGARPGMPAPWRTNNSGLAATYYLPEETDASPGAWGDIGHPLSWWKANHPDWVLYACTASGAPTTTPAYVSELPENVPLDIHNPAVVAYQMKLAATYAHASGYTGLAIDEVLFENIDGTGVSSTDYGCGIYEGNTFVRRYSGRNDPAWNTDTVAWVKAARSILKTDPVIGPYNLKLIVNHPAYSVTTTNEQTVLQNVDAALDEAGFTVYGGYKSASNNYVFNSAVAWMKYAQSHGVAPLIVDKFDQSTPITALQLEYSIATYMMGNEGTARLFVGNTNGYGAEQYHSEYATNYGAACGEMYGGASYNAANPQIYYRRFANAIVIVNSGSLPRASELATLPAGHTYKDLEGRTVTNPLTVASNDAYVLLTTNGCN